MSDFITLSCPSCGGKLQITRDLDRFACGHCGNEHLVRRQGGTVSLAPIADDVRNIRSGVDRTAAELAIARITKELDSLETDKKRILDIPKKEILRIDAEIERVDYILQFFSYIVAPIVFIASISAGNGAIGFWVALLLFLITNGMYSARRNEAVKRQRDRMIASVQVEIDKRESQLDKLHAVLGL